MIYEGGRTAGWDGSRENEWRGRGVAEREVGMGKAQE